MKNKVTEKVKTKLKKGDKVQVIAGSDKGKQGKILDINRETNRVIVEGVNMLTKHIKPGKSRTQQQGGLIHQEGSIHASNVMYLNDGKPTRLGLQVSTEAKGTKTITTKLRIAKTTSEVVKG